MRTARALIAALAAAASLMAGAAGAAKPPDFVQATQVEGKVPVSLAGAWFVYAQAEFPGGKTRALPPQVLTASQNPDHGVALHLLDVQLPKSIDEPYKSGNRQPKAWEPKPEDVALLRKEWSKLPPATKKDLTAGDVIYDRVDFTLASPEKYNEVFTNRSAGIDEALAGSLFALQVVEKYRPQQVPSGQNVAQVMERRSIYVVRRAGDSMLEGKQFTGYVAAGPGLPIPISFNGPFKLYRLAKGAGGPPPAAPAARGKGATQP
jgi:hypothetical protein